MKTKRLMALVTGATLIFGLVGCGTASGTAGSTSQKEQGSELSTETAEASGGKEIVLWTLLDNEAEVLQKYADQWGEETGNKVTIVVQSTDIQQFSQAVNSKDGPDGMFGIANDMLASYVAANLVAEVPEDLYQDSDFTEAAAQAVYMDGKRYAVPITVETPFLYYNTEKVSEVPATWEEMIDIAKDKGGISFEATSVYYDLGFLRAYDSYLFKYKDGAYDTADIGLGNEGAVKAYSLLKEMADEGFFASDVTYDTAKSSFQNGDSAFYIGGAWDVSGFTEAGTPFAVSDFPTLNGTDFVTPVGTYVGFVSAKSDATAETFDLYNYLVKNALMDIYEAGNRIPATIEAEEQVKDASDITSAQIKQITKGEPLPTVSEMGLVWQPFSDNMQLLFSNQITAEDAASYVNDQLKEAVSMMKEGQ